MAVTDNINQYLSRSLFKLATLTGSFMVGGSFIYAFAFEPYNIEITRHQVPIKNLSPTFNDYKIVQISDLHMGPWVKKEWLNKVVHLVNDLEPDLVAITGDFVTLGRIQPYKTDLVNVLSQIQSKDGVVGVLGNHDHFDNTQEILTTIQNSGITVLINDSFIIEHDEAQLAIAGLDDVWEEKHNLEKLITTLHPDIPTVLLVHEPDIADQTSQTGYFSLQLSGHSHGGQVKLPVIDIPYLPRLCRRYPSGRYQIGEMVQYTNRGIGMVDLPIRFRCRPEISVFHLHSE